ncbi:MAG: hypothetical protein IKV19_06295 [Bacteroidaceae bacterium]|nr:hypothetical protein [Bacteroidaceae bacterium]
MRYTYLFTQMSREENGNWVPVKEKPNEFVFTFGKKIEIFLGDSPDNTVLFTKDMWKENPAKNEEILPTVCFSAASKQGYRRPLVMSKEADKIAGLYRYKLVYDNEIKEGKYLSEDIRRLIGIFVNGVKAVNDNTMSIPSHNLADANVKYLMSYITSHVYVQLLQNKDKKGKARAEDYLKKVLETFFSLIPDKIIEKFDEGLEVHDEIRARLENVPEEDIATYKAVLKSQNYFKTVDDFNLFVILHDFILRVKNRYNHLVWVMFRSKIGLVSLNNVKKQLGAIFGFVSKVQDNYEPKGKKQILEAVCAGDRYHKDVAGFLKKIYELFDVENMNKTHRAALCYKFRKECNHKYLNSKFKCYDEIAKVYKPLRQELFRDLCLRYWGIEETSTLKPNKCRHLMEEFSSYLYDKEVWEPMRK